MNSPLRSDHPVRDVVAAADRQRRERAAFASVQRLAPWAAGATLLVALASRWRGAPLWVVWAALASSAAILAALWTLQRRSRATTDAIALAVDADAGLEGELRSAHWFEAQPGRDQWTDYHLEHAASKMRGVDWSALYPAVRSTRTWMVTGLLAAGVIAAGVRLPGARSATKAATVDIGVVGAELPTDVQDKLARLMAQLDDVALDPDAKKASLADLKKLMESLDPALQKKLQAALDKAPAADPKAKSDQAKADPSATPNVTKDLPEDLKWAQENQAARSAQADDRKPASTDPAQPTTKSGDASAATMQAQTEPGGKADAAAPIVKESASDEAGKKMMGGGGPMGGDSRPGAGKTNNNVKGAAEALLAAKKLRQELLEANADALGDNVDKEDLRRKTEQGTSSLGFTHAAASRTVDPSRSAAPPPVPEPRRSLLFHYFIRR
jgi:hypothetical protein